MPFLEFMRLNWQWMSGAGALVIGFITFVIARIIALEKGVQALLRAQMITYYQQYKDTGVTLYIRQSFENCWVQYEKLGKNGMMHDIHDKFMNIKINE